MIIVLDDNTSIVVKNETTGEPLDPSEVSFDVSTNTLTILVTV